MVTQLRSARKQRPFLRGCLPARNRADGIHARNVASRAAGHDGEPARPQPVNAHAGTLSAPERKTPAITPVTLLIVATAHIEPADYSSAVLDLIAALAALEYAVAEIGLTDRAGGIAAFCCSPDTEDGVSAGRWRATSS